MLVEITEVKVSKDRITLTAINLENFLLAEDLYAPSNGKPVKFVFEHEEGPMKYLYKVCKSQKACQKAQSMGEMIDALPGCIINLAPAFIPKK